MPARYLKLGFAEIFGHDEKVSSLEGGGGGGGLGLWTRLFQCKVHYLGVWRVSNLLALRDS